MTDKKYTNEDIISSLKVIATTGNCNECKIRNCKWGTCNCSQITANVALDLINRQNAEIKRLQKEVNLVSIQFQDLQERTDEVKLEAYKEFAEKLEEKLGCCHIISDGEYCGFDCGDTHECIDDLLKEMVGEEK